MATVRTAEILIRRTVAVLRPHRGWSTPSSLPHAEGVALIVKMIVIIIIIIIIISAFKGAVRDFFSNTYAQEGKAQS